MRARRPEVSPKKPQTTNIDMINFEEFRFGQTKFSFISTEIEGFQRINLGRLSALVLYDSLLAHPFTPFFGGSPPLYEFHGFPLLSKYRCQM